MGVQGLTGETHGERERRGFSYGQDRLVVIGPLEMKKLTLADQSPTTKTHPTSTKYSYTKRLQPNELSCTLNSKSVVGID